MSRTIFSFILAITLSACTINRPIQTLDPKLLPNTNIIAYPLYGDLIKEDEHWIFANINNKKGDVLLNSLTLSDIVKSDAKSCSRGLLGLSSGNCESIDSPWIRNIPMERNLYLFPITWSLAPLGLLISWFSHDYTDPDVFFLPIQMLPTYDNKKLNSAITEATTNAPFNTSIEEIIHEYKTFQSTAVKNDGPYPEFNKEELDLVTKNLAEDQIKSVTSTIKKQLTLEQQLMLMASTHISQIINSS